MSSIINVPQPKSFFSGKKKRYLKKALIILGVVVLIAGTVAGIWFYLESRKQANEQKIYEISNNSNEVVEDIAAGNYDESQVKLDENLAYTDDKVLEARIYIQKSSVAFSAGDYEDSFDFAKKSEELNPSSGSAKMMAEASVKKGDNDTAIKYYKITIERITGTGDMYDLDRAGLQEKIDALEAKK